MLRVTAAAARLAPAALAASRAFTCVTRGVPVSTACIQSLRPLCRDFSSRSKKKKTQQQQRKLASADSIDAPVVARPRHTTSSSSRSRPGLAEIRAMASTFLASAGGAAASPSPSPVSASSSSSPAASPGAVAAAKHAAVDFFDSHPTSFVNLLASGDQTWLALGRSQLAGAMGVDPAAMPALEQAPDTVPAGAGGGWLPTPEAEQAEIASFLSWVHSAAANPLVRAVVEELPAGVYAGWEGLIARAEIVDFSPKGRVDDIIFEKHRDVWERITRGCAVLRLYPTAAAASSAAAPAVAAAASGSASSSAAGTPILRWAVRANKKFTGHEDENNVPLDGKLYVVANGGGPATHVVVSHKCNGSVLHLSARDVTLWNSGRTVRWIFLGSKKVHAGAVWDATAAAGSVQDWVAKMRLFAADRHEYVAEMVGFVAPKLAAPATGARMLDLLARARLVLNAEYVSSVGTGPTDNRRIHGLADAEARECFGFMITCNGTAFPPPAAGMELGLDMLYGLYLMRAVFGLAVVSAFRVPVADLPAVKDAIIPLADIEGAVLYYTNERGLLQMEKYKSAGYVIVRAVREKLRPFIYGGRAGPGLEELLASQAAALTESAIDQAGKGLTVTRVMWDPAAAANATSGSPKAASGQKSKSALKREKKKAKAALAKAAGEQAASGVDEAAAAVGALAVGDLSPSSAAAAASDPGDGEAKDSNTPAIAASAGPAAPSSAPALYLEFAHAELDTLGTILTSLGAQRVRSGAWRVLCPADSVAEDALVARVRDAFKITIVQRPFALALARVQDRVAARIRAIDHIPLRDADRARWVAESAAFLAWLVECVAVRRRWAAREVMGCYSSLWSIFREEQGAQLQQMHQNLALGKSVGAAADASAPTSASSSVVAAVAASSAKP